MSFLYVLPPLSARDSNRPGAGAAPAERVASLGSLAADEAGGTRRRVRSLSGLDSGPEAPRRASSAVPGWARPGRGSAAAPGGRARPRSRLPGELRVRFCRVGVPGGPPVSFSGGFHPHCRKRAGGGFSVLLVPPVWRCQ